MNKTILTIDRLATTIKEKKAALLLKSNQLKALLTDEKNIIRQNIPDSGA